MKKLLIAGSIFFLCMNAYSQNVGVGITHPANKLQVNGTFVVTEATNSTNTPPTAGQTYTMNNGGYIYIEPTDSTSRIYDPGGPGGNYVTNLVSEGRIGTGSTAVELIIEDIDLGTGDSLLFFDFSYNRIFALSQSNQGIGSFRLTVNTQIDFQFKSNSDGSNGRGYAILIKRLYASPENINASSFTGNCMYFDTKNGAFRIGRVDGSPIGASSVALGNLHEASGSASVCLGGYNSTASGIYSTVLGVQAKAIGDYSLATGYTSSAIGAYSRSMGQGTISNGEGSTAMGIVTTANGEYSTALGSHTYANGYSSMVIGMYNDSIVSRQGSVLNNTPLFVIGNGNGTLDRNNAMVVRKSGNVGIGTNSPNTLLHIDGGSEASNNNGSGYLVIGNISGTNIVFDNNEIIARDNGAASNLYMQTTGGNVGIGTTSPAYLLEVNGTAAKPGGGFWSNSSDARLKQDVQPYTDGLSALLKINPVWYRYNEISGYNTNPKYVGVIAQELQQAAPYMVSVSNKKMSNGSSGYLEVDNSAMTYMLINAVKEQQQQIEELKVLVNELRRKIK